MNHERALRENDYWVGNLVGSLLDGTDPARILTRDKEIDAITVADLQKTAQRYFDMDNYVQVVLKPEVPAQTRVASSGAD